MIAFTLLFFFPPSVLSVCKLLLMYMKRCELLCMLSAVRHTVSEGVALAERYREGECISRTVFEFITRFQ